MPASVQFDSSSEQILEAIRKNLLEKLDAVGAKLVARAERNVALVGGRSKPGESPRVETAKLYDSIGYRVNEEDMSTRVGTNLFYGILLERGTKGGKTIHARPGKFLIWVNEAGEKIVAKKVVMGPIAPRPWLKKTLDQERPAIQELLSQGNE